MIRYKNAVDEIVLAAPNKVISAIYTFVDSPHRAKNDLAAYDQDLNSLLFEIRKDINPYIGRQRQRYRTFDLPSEEVG